MNRAPLPEASLASAYLANRLNHRTKHPKFKPQAPEKLRR